MSGLDPLAAFAAQVLANANAAIEQATLDLGVAVTELQAQIAVGDVIVATVLPATGDGVDRIALLGQTVPAQLPPGINPGESIAVQVTGFTNTAVLVRNLGPVDPQNPPTAVDFPPPQAAPSAALPAQTAILTTRNPVAQNSPAPAVPASSAAAPPAPSSPIAPPREVFVAASVRDGSLPLPEVIVSNDPSALPSPAEDLNARIAMNRTAPLPARTPPLPARPLPPTSVRPPPLASVRPPQVAPLPARGSVPPIITPARTTTPEVVLLTRLGVPISAMTLAAARNVNSAAQNVTASYQQLETLLADVTPTEQTTALRSALAFVAKFDVRNVRTLPEQIASFVSNVVDGAESKIAQIVRAWSTGVALSATQEETPAGASSAQSAVTQTPQTSQTPQTPLQTSQAPQPIVAATVEARSAERMVALEHDVKTAILALVENPPPGSSPQVAAALREALTATNALQLNVLSSRTNDSNAITIPLPAYFYDGGKPAHIRISRDGPGSKKAMDADNFHVSFILDTKSLGTVGIDVQTVGRSVSVDVKTQAGLSAERFRASFGRLRTRLEQLHYRVATMAAGALVPSPAAAQTDAVTNESPTHSNLDTRA
ncbi:MAG TPA: flagellar hook-length control protein FliK [Candidatus Baltobacteraceae bacterium]|nr:flagellar hook-length control protein FliK [Candidatus Baltobacteraceae bacterium]